MFGFAGGVRCLGVWGLRTHGFGVGGSGSVGVRGVRVGCVRCRV